MQDSERSGGDPGAWGLFCGGPCSLGGRMLSPRARGPRDPTRIPPIWAWSEGAAQRRPLETRQADAHPASDPADASPRRISAMANPQTPHRPLAATKVLDHRGCRASALLGK